MLASAHSVSENGAPDANASRFAAGAIDYPVPVFILVSDEII
jgi:hypothetical protein